MCYWHTTAHENPLNPPLQKGEAGNTYTYPPFLKGGSGGFI